MINLDRLKLAREAHTSNCVGTALYLFGITDSDMTINLHKSYKNHLKLATFCNASDLEKIDSPEEDCLAIFVPAIASYGLNAGVTHAGIITAQQKSLGKWGLSSYIYQELKEMCQWSTFKRNRYGSREDFYKRMKEKREIIAKVRNNFKELSKFDLKNVFMVHRAGKGGLLCLDELEFYLYAGGEERLRYMDSEEKPLVFFRRRDNSGLNDNFGLKDILQREGFIEQDKT